ncbi:MAG: ankyrin repeat domain-containing protein [Brevinema sp.]
MKHWIFFILMVSPVLSFSDTIDTELMNIIPTASKKEIQYLVSEGANINATNNNASSLLMIALTEGNSDGADTLIQLGADVNVTDLNGDTALILAAKYGHRRSLELILPRVSNINQQNSVGAAIHHASQNGFLKIFRRIATQDNINSISIEGFTPLMYAAFNGHLNIVRYMFKNFTIDQSLVNKFDNTALTIALKRRYPKIAKELISNQHPKTTDADGMTPLMIAAAYGSDQNIQDLIQYGCQMEAKDKSQNTALLHAIKNNQLESLKKLLVNGVDVNAVDLDGNSSLIIAAKFERIAAIALLLQSNADKTIVNKEKMTALDYAKKERNTPIIQLLKR